MKIFLLTLSEFPIKLIYQSEAMGTLAVLKYTCLDLRTPRNTSDLGISWTAA